MRSLILQTTDDIRGVDIRLGEMKFKLKIPTGTSSYARYFLVHNNSNGYVRLDNDAKFTSTESSVLPYDKTALQTIQLPEGEYNAFFSDKYFFEDFNSGVGFSTEHMVGSTEVCLQEGNFKQATNLKRVSVGNLKGADGGLLVAKKAFNLDNMISFACVGVTNDTLKLNLHDFYKSFELEKIELWNQSGVTGDLSALSALTNIKDIVLRAIYGVSGNVSDLAGMTGLENLRLDFTYINGDLEDLLVGLFENGRTSGTLYCILSNSRVKFHSQSQGTGSSYSVAFAESGISVSKGGDIVASYDGTAWAYV